MIAFEHKLAAALFEPELPSINVLSSADKQCSVRHQTAAAVMPIKVGHYANSTRTIERQPQAAYEGSLPFACSTT
jgi:hypothetical protein